MCKKIIVFDDCHEKPYQDYNLILNARFIVLKFKAFVDPFDANKKLNIGSMSVTNDYIKNDVLILEDAPLKAENVNYNLIKNLHENHKNKDFFVFYHSGKDINHWSNKFLKEENLNEDHLKWFRDLPNVTGHHSPNYIYGNEIPGLIKANNIENYNIILDRLFEFYDNRLEKLLEPFKSIDPYKALDNKALVKLKNAKTALMDHINNKNKA